MTGRLPPLAALRAFEAAARHSSFTRAAAELAMTQAAVSYQIRILEERVGSPLFLRRPRQVVLTETGQALALAATDAFRKIGEAYETARTGSQGTLSITTIPTFAANWLALHLGAFQMEHPRIAVRIETSDVLVDLARDNYDVAIRSGTTGHWPGLDSHFLFRETFSPMLSPALAASIGGVREPADLLRLPIIGSSDDWWRIWFGLVGVDAAEDLAGRPDSRFGSQSYEGRAAVAGLGVGILTPGMFVQELASGSLIQPFDILGDDGQSYWLAYEADRRNVAKIRSFREWLLPNFAAP
ncbi:MAG: LysR family transcriptional regulator [Rhizobiaceae bacterium]|nr:LysR family transcriptional regulator [Rhizobiaceae bacterium]